MQVGGTQKLKPGPTLHDSSFRSQNPLIGYSEGEMRRKKFQEQYKEYALSKDEGSILDIKERSRSRSRRAKYER